MTRDEAAAWAKIIAPHPTPEGSRAPLDWRLVLALIEQESGYDEWAIRYEPAFYTRYIEPLAANGAMSATEARARAFSWGCMQVMGQTAREHGYEGPLPHLLKPEAGIEVGCRVLARALKRTNGDVRLALLRYNGGGRPAYADEVLARVDRFEALA